MSQARRVAVVIVNYRTPELTQDALSSLAGELDPLRDSAVVVDNASGDGSAERLEAWIAERGFESWARVLRAPRNAGYAAGNNLGIRSVDAELYLLLNSDAQLRAGALAALLAAAAAHPDAGLLGPRIEDPAGVLQMSCFRFHSPISELIHAAATGPLNRLLRRFDVALGETGPEPEWLSFACVLIRRAVIDGVGLLDEGYFLYYEDVDFCRRARRAGWRHRLVPEARVLHLHGASSALQETLSRRERAPAYLYDSRARYFTRFYGRRGLWLANLLFMLGRSVSLARERFGSKPPHTCEAEWLDNWRGRPGL
jgi:GT2 family glycosyltransferase